MCDTVLIYTGTLNCTGKLFAIGGQLAHRGILSDMCVVVSNPHYCREECMFCKPFHIFKMKFYGTSISAHIWKICIHINDIHWKCFAPCRVTCCHCNNMYHLFLFHMLNITECIVSFKSWVVLSNAISCNELMQDLPHLFMSYVMPINSWLTPMVPAQLSVTLQQVEE